VQPVVRLLLRLAAAASVVVFVVLLPRRPQNLELVLGTTILLIASSSFISFPATAPDLQQSALFRLLCMTGQS